MSKETFLPSLKGRKGRWSRRRPFIIKDYVKERPFYMAARRLFLIHSQVADGYVDNVAS